MLFDEDGAIRRAIRSKIANSSGSGPRSVTSTCHASGIERDRARVNDQRVAVHLQRTDDDLRGADELRDANDGRVGQRRGRRHLQPLERGARARWREIALVSSAVRSSVSSTADASPSQKMRLRA